MYISSQERESESIIFVAVDRKEDEQKRSPRRR